ncbi:hypothetical protein B0H12DRAFT_1020891 [Mycena haematopus]|nr:hypothetical protein B0H12DRAFT_1020891 [Mycena haematopus]
MKIFTYAFWFAAVVTVAHAAPSALDTAPEARDVYAPHVTYPHAGTVWKVGQRHNVTWDVTHPPSRITNNKGQIVLRKGNITTPVILRKNFPILLGRIEVRVPRVKPGDDYQLVLFGDSGNFSPYFTIARP